MQAEYHGFGLTVMPAKLVGSQPMSHAVKRVLSEPAFTVRPDVTLMCGQSQCVCEQAKYSSLACVHMLLPALIASFDIIRSKNWCVPIEYGVGRVRPYIAFWWCCNCCV